MIVQPLGHHHLCIPAERSNATNSNEQFLNVLYVMAAALWPPLLGSHIRYCWSTDHVRAVKNEKPEKNTSSSTAVKGTSRPKRRTGAQDNWLRGQNRKQMDSETGTCRYK